MSLFKGINVVSYNVTDWEGAKTFYKDTLGLAPVAFLSDEAGWMEFGGEHEAHLSINRWDGPDPVPPRNGGATVVFTVDDASQVVAELRKRGVKCEDPVTIPGMVTYATFFDPEGNRLQMA
ncbi:MAG TPA: VOC family protein, partial [Anaerolineae bacterium]|nr:VOC family protein [Anaerolineae bacterium]